MGESGLELGKSWRETFIKSHNEKILLQIVLFPIIPFVFVLVQAILWPGYIFCQDNGCPDSYTPSVPDVATIPIVLCIYTYCTILSLAIAFSSGAWMRYAFRNKLTVITVVFLMVCSCFQMIAPVSYRGFVIPYYSVQPYKFQIIQNTSNSATLQVSNIWSQYLDQRNVLVEVRQMNGNVQNLQLLSPLSEVIFHDDSFSDTTVIQQGVTINRVISDLEQDKWYIWTVIPAYSGAGTAAVGTYIQFASSLDIANNNTTTTQMYTNTYLDLRAFKTCKWDNNNGCEGGIH